MQITYQVRPFDDEVRAAYERLLPEQTTMIERGKLDWKFRDCPAGTGVLALATSDETEHPVIGVNAFQPARLKIGDKRVLAFQSMDTIVDPVARGKGVFTKLIGAFYDQQPAHGGALLYGVPNGNSAPGFFGKLGWTELEAPPFVIKPLKAGYFARRLLGKIGGLFDAIPLSFAGGVDPDMKRIDRFGPDADALWDAFSAKVGCAVDRRSDLLNWRFVDHPAEKYEILGLEGPDGQLAAFVVWRPPEAKHGGAIGYVMEAMAKPGHEAALRRLISAAVGEMRRAGADAVLAWSAPFAPNHGAFAGAGFLPMPEKIRPIELHFGGRVLTPEAAGADQRGAWYLSYFDSDTV